MNAYGLCDTFPGSTHGELEEGRKPIIEQVATVGSETQSPWGTLRDSLHASELCEMREEELGYFPCH